MADAVAPECWGCCGSGSGVDSKSASGHNPGISF